MKIKGLLARAGSALVTMGMMAGVAAVGSSAYADEPLIPSEDKTIAVKADSADLLAGHDFEYLQLANFTYASKDGDYITGLDLSTTKGLEGGISDSLLSAGIKQEDILSSNPMVAFTTLKGDTDVDSDINSDTWKSGSAVRTFVDALYPKLADNSGWKLAHTETQGNESTFSVDKAGIYLVRDIAPEGAQTAIPMLVSTELDGGFRLNGVTMGRTWLKLEKVEAPVKTVNLKNNESIDQGKDMSFRLVQKTMPTVGYDKFTFNLEDTMGPGLTFDSFDSVKVADSNKEADIAKAIPLAEGDFTQKQNGQNISWSFTKDFLSKNIDKYLVVTYKAHLNAEAVAGEAGNPNDVKLVYSNNPSDSSKTSEVPGNQVKVYTGAFKLEKQNIDGQSLEGAEFTITNKADNSVVKFNKNGSAYDVDANGSLAAVTAGKVSVEGLEGDYEVKETKAPEGYSSTFMPTFTVHVHTTDKGTVVTLDEDSLKLASLADGATVQVKNIRNITEIGHTGAGGVVPFMAAAVLLFVGASILAVKSRRTSKAQVIA